MNLNYRLFKFQIAYCATVYGTPGSKFVKGISCWVIVMNTSQKIFLYKLWTKFGELTALLIRLKLQWKYTWNVKIQGL